MLNNNYICSLDIGSSKIAATLVLLKKNKVVGAFFDTVAVKGVKRGLVVDSLGLISSIEQAVKSLKSKSGVKIKFFYTNFSGEGIVNKHSHAIIPLAERGNKVITSYDINTVNEQARILGSSLDEDIIHAIPFSYGIDSQDNILSPLGLYSHKLEVDLYLICGKTASVQNLTRAANQAGYEVKDLFFSGLATSAAVMDKKPKEGVSLLCDVGSDIVELLFFKDGVLKDIRIVFVGGDDLSAHIGDVLRIPFELAEDVKKSYSMVEYGEGVGEDKEILIKKSNIYKPIKQKLVSELVTAKTRLLCSDIKEAVEKIITCNKINSFTVTGRCILLEGFLETLESTLGVSVKIGRVVNPSVSMLVNNNEQLSGQKYLPYATSLGMVCLVMESNHSQASVPISIISNPIIKAAHKVKEIYQEYF